MSSLSRQLKKEKEHESSSDSVEQTLTEAIARLSSRVDLIEEVLPEITARPSPSGEGPEPALMLVDRLQREQPDPSEDIDYLRDKMQEGSPDLLEDINDLRGKMQQGQANLHEEISDLRDRIQESQSDPFEAMDVLRTLLSGERQALADGLCGNAILRLDSAAEDVLATDINADDHTTEFSVSLDSTGGLHQWWASFPAVVSAAEFATDGDVVAPAVKYTAGLPADDPKLFIGGNLLLTVEFDNLGTVVAGDYFEVTIKVAADDLLPVLGYTVAEIVKRFDVI